MTYHSDFNKSFALDKFDGVPYLLNTSPVHTSTRCKKSKPIHKGYASSHLSCCIPEESSVIKSESDVSDVPASPEIGTQRVLELSDICFTQISPSGISAMCEAVDAVETSERLRKEDGKKSKDEMFVDVPLSACDSPILSQSRVSLLRKTASQCRGESSIHNNQSFGLPSQSLFCYPSVELVEKECVSSKLFNVMNLQSVPSKQTVHDISSIIVDERKLKGNKNKLLVVVSSSSIVSSIMY